MVAASDTKLRTTLRCLWCSWLLDGSPVSSHGVIRCLGCGLLYTVSVFEEADDREWEMMRLHRHPEWRIERVETEQGPSLLFHYAEAD